jgi:fructose-1,6-bisphosphatase/inositol monophosphatase family enzyme
MQGSANLNIMIKAARKAGRSLTKDFREVENLQVSSKGPGDFVSRADRAAEDILKTELLSARPNYGFLGEEGTEIAGADPTRRWIVDPLDGTTNFLHGMPHWAVSIALEHKGEIVAGVVFDPAKDEMFYAEKGAGAWLNDSQRLRVSGRARMIDCVFATGVPFGGQAKYLPGHASGPRAADAAGARVSGAGARRRSISPTWRRAATTATGSAGCTPGTSPPGSSWCARRAASWPRSASGQDVPWRTAR